MNVELEDYVGCWVRLIRNGSRSGSMMIGELERAGDDYVVDVAERVTFKLSQVESAKWVSHPNIYSYPEGLIEIRLKPKKQRKGRL